MANVPSHVGQLRTTDERLSGGDDPDLEHQRARGQARERDQRQRVFRPVSL